MADATRRSSKSLRSPTSAVILSNPTSVEKNDATNVEREYEFFVTIEPHQPDGVKRSLIRHLVMRNFLQTKSTGSGGNKSKKKSRQLPS